MIELYTAGTANGLRPAVMMEECNLPYRTHIIDLVKGEHRTKPFLDVNPSGTIPIMIDLDGDRGAPIKLSESWAIIVYCAEKAGRFIPANSSGRALAFQWLSHAAADVAATSATIFHLSMRVPEKSAKIKDYFEAQLVSHFRLVDRRLSVVEYLAGELSIADFGLYPTYATTEALHKTVSLKHLQRWGAAMGARPAVKRGMLAAG